MLAVQPRRNESHPGILSHTTVAARSLAGLQLLAAAAGGLSASGHADWRAALLAVRALRVLKIAQFAAPTLSHTLFRLSGLLSTMIFVLVAVLYAWAIVAAELLPDGPLVASPAVDAASPGWASLHHVLNFDDFMSAVRAVRHLLQRRAGAGARGQRWPCATAAAAALISARMSGRA